MTPPPLGSAASQMTETRELSIEEVFADAGSRKNYDKAHERLYLDVIVDAHECLRDARVILVETPLWLLQPGPAPVLYRSAVTYIQHAALHIINALTDSDPRALTFGRLKALLLATCDPQKKMELGRQLRRGFAANKFTSLRQRAEGLRDKGLAHYDLQYAVDPALRTSIGMTLKEVEELLDKAKGLLHVLKPGVDMSFDVQTMRPEKGMPYVVLQLMRDSERLAFPEKLRPEVFKSVVKNWDPAQKKVFNEWRVKIEKDPIDFD